MFVKPKYFKYRVPEYETLVEEKEDRFLIRVKAHSFANYVELYLKEADCVFSDNYFDITDPEGIQVSVEKETLPQGFACSDIEEQLRLKSVAESY